MSIQYRSDIDGLRAVAVMAVMLFHFSLIGVTGGYVGVDIFFCISGYLIGGIIIDETASGTFSYRRFYERRIKRLFPAFFAMALATVPLAWWLLLPAPDFVLFGRSLIAATVYIPNLFFYRELGGYFAANAAVMPLLHTWSLGVEEQFYIAFPLFMRFAIRGSARFTLGMLALVGLLSLAYAQRRLASNPMASFYWLQGRAWELLLGAAVALPAVRDLKLSAGVGRLMTALALIGIVLPMFLYTPNTRFPGLAALPPCLGTTWLLWWGRIHHGGLVQRALMAKVPVVIGRMSYSLYLWHWPVYVFLAYHLSGEIPGPIRLAALALVFLLSAVSWRFVEQPVRLSRPAPVALFGTALMGSVLVAGVGFWIWRTNGMPDRLSGDTRIIAAAAKDFVQTGGQCLPADNPYLPGLSHCRIGVQGAPAQFLIWADSHGRAIRDGADQAATEHGVAGVLIWSAGCLPAFGYIKHETYTGPEGDRECAAQNAAVKAMLAKPGTIKKVLLVGRWSYYTEGSGIGIDQQNRIVIERAPGEDADSAASVGQAEVVGDVLRQTVKWLSDHGYEVYLLQQFPEFPDFSGERLFQLVRSGQQNLQGAIAAMGSVKLAQVQARQRTADQILQQAARESGAHVLLTHQLFCGVELCSVWSPSGQAYFDNNHLTVTASKQIRQVFVPVISH